MTSHAEHRISWGRRSPVYCILLSALGLDASANIETAAEVNTLSPTPETSITRETSTLVYDAAFFSRFNPINAYDILSRIPGVKALLDAETNSAVVRGFGSGGDQILINGKRIAGKANEISAALQRIQATQVQRVEIIRGNSADVDVRSEGNLVNLVVNGQGETGSGSWRLTGNFYDRGDVIPGGYLAYGGARGRLDYFISAELSSFYQNEASRELFLAEDFSLVEDRFEIQRSDWEYHTFTSNLIYNFDNGDEWRINGFLETVDAPTQEEIYRTVIETNGGRQVVDTRLSVEDTLEWELGSDFVHLLDNGGKFDLLALYTTRDNTDDQPQDRIENNLRTARSYDISRTATAEAILRATYQWPIANRQTLELGLEGAYNQLDKSFVLYLPDEQGLLQPADVFNADSVVDEVRYELFSTHRWAVSPRLHLESALNLEYSKITQDGSDVDNSRDFSYIKPRLDLRYDLSNLQQLRFKIERTVGQLDFASFVSFFDVEIDSVQGGNPELEPEQAWEYEIGYDHRLPADQGVVKTRLFYQDIEDHVSKVGISPLLSVPGNIGDASVYGAEIETSLRLTALGMPDAVISTSYLWRDSKVTDPFSGRERKVNRLDDYRWSVGFRHDVTVLDLSYGFDVIQQGPNRFYDIDEIEKSSREADATLFIEKRIWGGVKVRAEGFQLLGHKNYRSKVRGIIPQQLIERREELARENVNGVRLILTGNF